MFAEATGLGVPTVVLPFANTAMASCAPFRRSIESLRAEGVRILLREGGQSAATSGRAGAAEVLLGRYREKSALLL
ncbi:MAG: hypothetical protein ACRDTK_20895 [Mycobacterium sp.]